MEQEELKQFDMYKSEYSSPKTTGERKQELIKLMRENLKRRRGEESSVMVCLDAKEHSVDSNCIEDLYAIDTYLREQNSKRERDEFSEMVRTEALKNNKYGPDNPYPKQ